MSVSDTSPQTGLLVSAVWQFPPDFSPEGTRRPVSPLQFNQHLVSDNFLRTLFSKESPECFKQVCMSPLPLGVGTYIIDTILATEYFPIGLSRLLVF